jgi:hypothetical protein
MGIEKKSKLLEVVQLNSTANSAHLARFLGKWTGLALLFSW